MNDRTIIGMAKINWKHSKTAYLIAGITALIGIAEYTLEIVLKQKDNATIAIGNYAYLLPLCFGIFVPALGFSRLMHLGGKRMDFFKSSVVTYAAVAAVISLLSILTHITVDRWMLLTGQYAGLLDCLDAFGFMSRGVLVAFIQMTVFLLFVACVAHTLTLVQGQWYGWLADAIIIVTISVTPLRAILGRLFNMIIFNSSAVLQILSGVIVSAVIYGLSIVPIRSRVI